MTSLSQWLRAEELDKSEPAGFYCPGATDWRDKEAVRKQTARRTLEARWDRYRAEIDDLLGGKDDVSRPIDTQE